MNPLAFFFLLLLDSTPPNKTHFGVFWILQLTKTLGFNQVLGAIHELYIDRAKTGLEELQTVSTPQKLGMGCNYLAK